MKVLYGALFWFDQSGVGAVVKPDWIHPPLSEIGMLPVHFMFTSSALFYALHIIFLSLFLFKNECNTKCFPGRLYENVCRYPCSKFMSPSSVWWRASSVAIRNNYRHFFSFNVDGQHDVQTNLFSFAVRQILMPYHALRCPIPTHNSPFSICMKHTELPTNSNVNPSVAISDAQSSWCSIKSEKVQVERSGWMDVSNSLSAVVVPFETNSWSHINPHHELFLSLTK